MPFKNKTFLAINFGCRVNAAETNQYSQTLVNQGYLPTESNPDLIFVNTCAVTKKGEYESLSTIKKLASAHPKAKIIATGCANISKLTSLPNLEIITKRNSSSVYTPAIGDKYSHTHRYLLKIQSGCTQACSYCTVPQRRPDLWSLPIADAVTTVNQAITNGYTEIIITGVNLAQYTPGLSFLLQALLTQTTIPLISFGSLPLNCLDEKLFDLYKNYSSRLSHFLHIPIQSGSDKILKLMHRPYVKKDIIAVFNRLKKISLVKGRSPERSRGERDLKFGTDIIVGFPTETDTDFQKTFDLCQSIGFTKIHVFKFSPRPGTPARQLFLDSSKLSPQILRNRSHKIRSLTFQTTLPSHQTPKN